MKRNCNIQNITIILQILYFIGRNFFEQLFGGGGLKKRIIFETDPFGGPPSLSRF